MTKSADWLPQALLGGLVALAVIAGWVTVGGLEAGRTERRDKVRLGDLRKLSEFVRCVGHAESRKLPETLEPHPTCTGEARLADPYTDEPYTYRKTSFSTFQLCAVFEAPEAMAYTYVANGNFDPNTGCATVTYR